MGRKALLLALSGVRIVDDDLRALGRTLPGFVHTLSVAQALLQRLDPLLAQTGIVRKERQSFAATSRAA